MNDKSRSTARIRPGVSHLTGPCLLWGCGPQRQQSMQQALRKEGRLCENADKKEDVWVLNH